MKGHKRFRDGAWRLVVTAGTHDATGRRKNIYETVRAPNNRRGAKLADARLAELIAAVESGQEPQARAKPNRGPSVVEVAAAWQEAHRPQRDRRGEWLGWSPKTAMVVADNFRLYVLPVIGASLADQVTGLQLDRLYRTLEEKKGLSPAVVSRCHSQIRSMYNWGLRKKLVTSNPALCADPPRTKPRQLEIPSMAEVRAVQDVSTPEFSVFIQLAATVGARRGTLIALRWGDIDLKRATITFTHAFTDSAEGQVEKGTKADRPYAISLGPATVEVLSEHRRRAVERALSTGVSLGPGAFVFSDDGGATPWSLENATHSWRRYSRRAGISHLRLHDLRHTAASQMLMAGVPISVVAERLGCTEGNILRNYRHFIPGADREAADLMDRLLLGVGPGN